VTAKRRGDPEEPLSVDRAERCSKSNVQQPAGVSEGCCGPWVVVRYGQVNSFHGIMDGLYIVEALEMSQIEN
jgi:hypothetical protein